MERILILVPNWLGDAVMALPAIADVRRANPGATLTVGARASTAPLFGLVPEVNATVTVGRGLGAIARSFAPAAYDVAILLPNSLHAALLVRRVPERWGYRTEYRGPLLTRAIDPPRGLHQVTYYQHLVAALGIANGDATPRVCVPREPIVAAERLLRERGWDGTAPLVALAPGAAYGGAKRWPPTYFGELAAGLAADGVIPVLVGSAADALTGREVAAAAGAARIIDLIGATSLPILAGVFRHCRAVVSNDSGAMHLAAATGTRVIALFGPTDETRTSPSPLSPEPLALGPDRDPPRVRILLNPVWCRPCMLRECPLDHACMKGLGVERVRRTLLEAL